MIEKSIFNTKGPRLFERCMGRKIGMVSKSFQNHRNFDRIDGEEFEWNIFPGFNTLQLSQEVKSLLLRLNETPENFTKRIVFMSHLMGIKRQ